VRAAFDGASEIGFTVVGITLVIIVVFLPITLSNDLVSNVIRQFAVTVMIATAFSFLASFTLVPWLSSRFGKLEHVSNITFFGRIIFWFVGRIEAFTHWFSSLFERSLNRRTNKIITL